MFSEVSILNVLIDALVERLLETLIYDVDDSQTKAGLVRFGRLQDDPTIAVRNVLVRESPEPHILNKSGDDGITAPTYLIGGGYHAYWRRRFIVEFELFFDNENDRDVARNKANVIFSRAQRALATMNPSPVFTNAAGEQTCTDDFGETPAMIFVTSVLPRESGGPGTFIWRGEIKVEFLTEIQVD